MSNHWRTSAGPASAPKRADFSPYTTLVIGNNCASTLRGFGYKIGDCLSATTVVATQRETNMEMSAQLWQEPEVEFIGLEWCLQAVTPAEFMANSTAPYRLVDSDVVEFARRSFIRVYVNGRYEFVLVPDRHEVVRDMMGARQRVPFPQPIQVRSRDQFTVDVDWPRQPPVLSSPDARLTLVIRLLTQDDAKWIQYGKWSGSKDDKTKAYVVVGKEGLDELLAELLGVDSKDVKGEK